MCRDGLYEMSVGQLNHADLFHGEFTKRVNASVFGRSIIVILVLT